ILPSRRSQRSPLERLGRACTSERRSRAPHAWRPEPLEPGQGLVLGAVTSRTGGRSRLRPYAGQPLPSHSAVSQVAHGQEAERLYICPARSCSARRAGGDFRRRSLSFAVSVQNVQAFNRSASFIDAIHASDCHPGRGFLAAVATLPAPF